MCPLLQKAKDAGEDAKAMSVLAAGVGGKIDIEDLGLKKNYSVSAAGFQAPEYNDCMIEVRTCPFSRLAVPLTNHALYDSPMPPSTLPSPSPTPILGQ